MRQSTRGDVQWSGGTSDPARALSCNFVRSPSGPASALVRLVADCFAESARFQSIQRHRVSGCPTWSESHCFRARVTMTTPSRAQVDFCVRRLRRPGYALRACIVRTAERLRAGCRSNGSWLLLRHGFGIKKLRNIYGRRCATTFVRQQ